MVSESKLYLQRSEDEILLSQKDLDCSINEKTKEFLGIQKDKTFYFSVISHAYYSIFYAAKAYLYTKGIMTKAPDEHQQTYEKFKMFVDKKIVDYELLRIYENEIKKAQSLLNIFSIEKDKRGRFTYNIQSEANLPYAKESIENSRKFVSVIKAIIEK